MGAARVFGACSTLGVGVLAAARTLGAQPPPGPRPGSRLDSARVGPARADTVRRPASPGTPVRAGSARRAAVSDSTQRDSLIARQRREARRGGFPGAGGFTLDRLRLNSVGVSAGVALPDQVNAATVYAVQADYGEVSRELRAVFGLTYWTSAFRAKAVDAFARSIAATAANGGPPPNVVLGRVRASDVALHADLRYRPRIIGGWRTPGALRPWVSGGAGVHLLDVQGAPISGTFVERALDGLAFGVAGGVGTDLIVTPSVRLTGQARYDLFNGAHFASVRAGGSYVFDGKRQ